MSSDVNVPAGRQPIKLDNVRVVHEKPVEMVAVEASVALMAADLLMKVADGQAVLKREAQAVEQQLRVAYDHNKLVLTPISRELGADLANGRMTAAIEKLREAEQADD